MSEQSKVPDWILEENEKLDSESSFDGEKLPSLKFEENVIVEFSVDFSDKFKMWEDKQNNSTKAIIPVVHGGENKILWLNTRNPLYREILKLGMEGQTTFKVIQTGNKGDTKYNLVKK